MALHYVGGILKHARALCAICSPTTNSYKRLVPGFEAPVNLAYSARNRSAAVRIPTYSENPKAKRIEYRPPDPAANIYLGYAALLMAGLDGVLNKIDPGEPLDKNIYELPPEELAKVPTSPAAWPKPWIAWRRTMNSCSKATCSRRTSSTCGSATSARNTTPCACARIPTNSSSTTTYNHDLDVC